MSQTAAPNLLLVDDDVDFADAQAEFLTGRGYRVKSAYDFAAAETSISEFTPQIALIDLRLGNDSGIRLLEVLRERVPGVVCIFMTGHADLESAIEALRRGATDYLRKPVAPEDLLQVLERNLERTRLLQEQEELRLVKRQDEIIKTSLNEEILLRRGVEAELRAHQENLEQLVEERTLALQASQERLNQASKMQALGTLAGGIAHDFNNILAGITGFTDLAINKSIDNAEISAYLKEIHAASQRAAELVGQILTFSRKTVKNTAVIEVEDVTREALGLLRQSIPSRIEIEAVYAAERTHVMADRTEMHQVLMNLCSNAASAIKDGAGTIRVALEDHHCETELDLDDVVLAPGHYLRLSVQDDGCGLEPEIRSRIFDPFFTTAGVGEGIGMGLALTHSIITGLSGAIRVISAPGSGATFEIFLPLTDREISSPAREAELVAVTGGRILAVDDEDMILRLYEGMLTPAGYEVVSRSNGEEALAEFSQNPDSFDLVITDESMPRLTGSDLSRKILQIRADQPILMCSGHAEIVGEELCETLGISGYLIKPVMLDVLLAKVAHLLKRTAP